MADDIRFEIDEFNFRPLHPNVSIGTASDRYAGWIGQIYSDGRYKINRRSKKIRRKSFSEGMLPVESVQEYFQHFSFLEIDFTFYRLILDQNLKPTPNYHLLNQYRKYINDGDDIFLKVPQAIMARKLFKDGKVIDNPDHLNPALFTDHFFGPGLEILGKSIKGFIFEQEYHTKKIRISRDEFIETLDEFLDAIPRDDRYHFEIRTDFYLTNAYFNILEKYGAGQVLSHWTWLPPLSVQFTKSGHRFLNSGKQCLVRLITPFGMRYEESYEKAFPFDKSVDGMTQPKMIDETVMLMEAAIDEDVHLNISVNNRAGGNAPVIARIVSNRFLERVNRERK